MCKNNKSNKFVRATRLLPSLSIKRLPFFLFFFIFVFFLVINFLSFLLHFSRTPKTLSNPRRQNTVSIFISWEQKVNSKTIKISPRENAEVEAAAATTTSYDAASSYAATVSLPSWSPCPATGLLYSSVFLLPFPCSIWVSRVFFQARFHSPFVLQGPGLETLGFWFHFL